MKFSVKAKKHLGQHFLNDPSVAQDVALLFAKHPQSLPVLEIGPGTGVLTEHLLQYYPSVSAIEIDTESVAYLTTHFVPKGLHLTEGDFLKHSFDLSQIANDMLIIGNFPYNISSQIVFKILDNVEHVQGFGGMFQKEVAERLVAKEGSKTYGILSVLLNAFYDCEYAFTVGPEKFTPPPKVFTGVIKCVRKANIVLPCSKTLFFEVVKAAFNQRRKTLRNALHKFNLQESHEFAKLRAEQLSVQDFIKLTQFIEQQ